MCLFPNVKSASEENCPKFLDTTEIFKQDLQQLIIRIQTAEYKLWLTNLWTIMKLVCQNTILPYLVRQWSTEGMI